MNREELIEEAADAMFTANDGQLGQGYDEMARAALVVFEQAHAPTEHPAHSGHEYGGGYARAAALAAGDPDWMNATGAPTDDERETP